MSEQMTQNLWKTYQQTTIQVYPPTTDAAEDEIECFQASIQEEVGHAPKQDMLIIQVLGMQKQETTQNQNVLENLAYRSETKQENDIEFCETNNLFIANT